MNRLILASAAAACALLAAPSAAAQQPLPAFPGAEGFGRYATGGRGGEIYHVTNLNDSGKGSLRDAISQPNRIIVFDVSGVINLRSRLVFRSNQTILGQTAPGEGVQIYGNGVSFSNANNIIVRYLRVRMGVNGDSGKDAAGVASGHDMMFDHMSVLWGRDETFSVSSDNKGSGPSNITIQNSIIGQGLLPHSCGGLIQTDNGVTLFRNLYIENSTRNPKVKGLNQFVNNVSYDWGKEAAYNMGGESAGESWAEISDNYWIAGPWRGAEPLTGGNSNFKFTASGNYYDRNKDGILDGAPLTDEEYTASGGFRVASTDALLDYGAPKAIPAIESRMSAPEALEYVIAYVGASLPVRDEVDQYVIDELTSFGTLGSTGGINTEKILPHKGTGTLFGGYKPLDSDADGIPDDWEIANGLDPNDPADAAAIAPNGYANIENYSFSITEAFPYIKNPTDLRSVKNEKDAISLEWKDNSDDETGFVVEISPDGSSYSEAGRTQADVCSLKVEGLEENKLYFFRVYALGSDGMRSVESAPMQTMTSEPFLPSLSASPSPAVGSDVKALDVVLGWTNDTKDYFGPVTYSVYIGEDPADLLLIASGLEQCKFVPGDIQPGKTYFWRVDASNDTGTTEGDIWNFNAVPGGRLFYTDFHTTPASFAESEWGTIIAGNQADIMKGVKDEVEFDNMVLGTDGGRLVAFGNLSPYPSYSSADNGASPNAVGFIGKQGNVDKCYIRINDIQAPFTITLFCGNSDKSAQSVALSTASDLDDNLATFKFKTSEKKTYKFTYTYEGTELCDLLLHRASLSNKGINFHDILIEQYVDDKQSVEGIAADELPVPDVCVNDGTVSVNNLDGRTVSIYDPAGRLIAREAAVKGSVGFPLGQGIFIIHVDAMRPLKIALTR
ncbi:MAG: hypothetical protein Q4C37_10215 [Bacteroidales bacterium]|nr:hypothetical protein [Bacteroidales bacterium]